MSHIYISVRSIGAFLNSEVSQLTSEQPNRCLWHVKCCVCVRVCDCTSATNQLLAIARIHSAMTISALYYRNVSNVGWHSSNVTHKKHIDNLHFLY